MKTAIILGSSRSNGATAQLAHHIAKQTNWEIFDLAEYKISPYDYESKNVEDDFLGFNQMLLDDFDHFIFATPVYWYAMSSQLKTFIDRFSDLVRIKKDQGRQWRGKKMSVMTTSSGGNLGEQFWIPFKEMANYLGVHYITNLHTVPEGIAITEDDKPHIQTFIQAIRDVK